ncbi:MAG TPA: carboxypeptidase-like regulatory domain-containing protein, partial [Pyrinomonadaceae bacterium]
MSFSTRYLPAVLLTILSIPTSLWAQAAPKQPTKAPRGSVSGRVTIKEKSAQGVVVSLRRNDFMNQFEVAQRATTDQDGNYRIVNVPPGTYEVTPSAPAFVPSDLKEQRNKTVLVGEDEDVENINFALVRGGVITGRVTDADGRP